MMFFLPRLVWCFTSAKAILISEYDTIEHETAKIRYYERLLQGLNSGEGTPEQLYARYPDPEYNQNHGQHFVYGTALNI